MPVLSNIKFVFQYLTRVGVRPCQHTDSVRYTRTNRPECGACLESGSTWVHLRMCTACGEVVCCDSSTEGHARRHVETTGHPITISVEPGESWQWCYPDNRLVARKTP